MTISRIERRGRRPALITGGAGFIGTNLAYRLLRAGRQVRIFDNLSRSGAQQNLRWLRAVDGSRLQFHQGDVRNAADIRAVLAGIGTVFHLAAQVAVTTSLADPREDFSVNAGGTLNLLEEIRRAGRPIGLVFTSTNKVYGALEDIPLTALSARYDPASGVSAIDETRPLSFHSPYGCSKGTADQYVLDYTRGYSVHAAVFRMSCIYGPHQYGTEDQGWVAHFLIQALQDMPVTIYGDGKQVRDLLYIDDLIDALLCAEDHLTQIAGQAFNIGGGPDNTMSLIELIERIMALNGSPPVVAYGPWRVGDQRWYVSNPDKFERATGWRPKINVEKGLRLLYEWLSVNRRTTPAARVAGT
jgi:CDP-paratose 2-epimerase